MALHPSLTGMVREALPEYVNVARFAIMTPKDGRGYYGYPAATLLFAVADAIGSYYEGDRSLTMQVDGRDCCIDGDSAKHYRILNSTLYGQSLTAKQIQSLYECYRNSLFHGASLVPGVLLDRGVAGDPVFYPDSESGERIECVNLLGFLTVTQAAVEKFLATADSVIPGSRRESHTLLKGGR